MTTPISFGREHYSEFWGKYEYLKTHPTVRHEIYTSVGRKALEGAKDGAIKGAVIGTVGGCITGGVAGYTVAVAVGGPVGVAAVAATVGLRVLAGAVIGAPVGAAAGAAVGGIGEGFMEARHQWKVVIPNSNGFLDWRAHAIIIGFFERFSTFIRNHARLADFICPITDELIIVPVIDRYGHTWEREKILEALALRPESPLTRQPLTPQDLQPNYGYHRTLVQELENILQGDGDVTPHIREGIGKYIEAVKRERTLLLLEGIRQITEAFQRNELTADECPVALMEVNQQFRMVA